MDFQVAREVGTLIYSILKIFTISGINMKFGDALQILFIIWINQAPSATTMHTLINIHLHKLISTCKNLLKILMQPMKKPCLPL